MRQSIARLDRELAQLGDHASAALMLENVTGSPFVPAAFSPPTNLATDDFHLEPLGPQHNAADYAAWTSSIEHIRATPGFPDGNWPPSTG